MRTVISSAAPPVLQEYYRILTGGPQAYAQGEALRQLLSDHLDFTGSLAGHRPDSTEGFLHGVAGFIASVNNLEIAAEVHDDRGSAVLYDAVLPNGTVRFAEFFSYQDGRISALQLHYDGADYLKKGGR